MISLQTKLLLLPAFIPMALVVAIGLRLLRARFAAGKAGLVERKRIALDNTAWPDNVRKLSNSYSSQFEFPVLYHALIPLLLVTGLGDTAQVVLSFLFVASRIAHSVVHTGGNVVVLRLRMFFLGVLCVVAMWVWFALRLYVAG